MCSKNYPLYIFGALSFVLIAAFSSCSEFIEPSIKNKSIVLNSPADYSESSRYNQSFWWEKVPNTRTYRLQIVSASFDSIAYLALDTVVSANKFNFTLEPGVYEWRVRAENSGSETEYVIRKLTIHQSSIASQQVQVISPSNALITNQSDILFKWHSLYGAKNYRLQIDTNNFEDEKDLVYDSANPGSEIKVPVTLERLYKWRLRAENDTAQSKWSGTQTFTYDITSPAAASLVSPANNAQVTKPFDLKWNIVPGAKKYQVTVYKTDLASPLSGFPVTVTGTAYNFTQAETGETLNWQVRAIDEAGNTGEYSTKRSFIIQ